MKNKDKANDPQHPKMKSVNPLNKQGNLYQENAPKTIAAFAH